MFARHNTFMSYLCLALLLSKAVNFPIRLFAGAYQGCRRVRFQSSFVHIDIPRVGRPPCRCTSFWLQSSQKGGTLPPAKSLEVLGNFT